MWLPYAKYLLRKMVSAVLMPNKIILMGFLRQQTTKHWSGQIMIFHQPSHWCASVRHWDSRSTVVSRGTNLDLPGNKGISRNLSYLLGGLATCDVAISWPILIWYVHQTCQQLLSIQVEEALLPRFLVLGERGRKTLYISVPHYQLTKPPLPRVPTKSNRNTCWLMEASKMGWNPIKGFYKPTYRGSSWLKPNSLTFAN